MARPKFIAFSPKTQTVGITAIDAVVCEVVNIDAFPDVGAGEYGYITFLPDKFGLSEDPTDYETATYTGKSGSELTGLTRAVEGTAQEWATGVWVLSGKTAHSDEMAWDELSKKYSPGVGNVTSFTATPVAGYDIELSWGDPDNLIIEGVTIATWAGTMVRRKLGSYPASETDGDLVVNSTDKDEYSATPYTDTDLLEDTEYFYMAFPYTTQDVYTVDASNRDSATTLDKSPQSPPAAPEVTLVTGTSATVTGEAGTEVSLDESTWYDTPKNFTGLDDNTSYTAYARMKETETHFASASSAGATFKTNYRYGFRITKAESDPEDRVTYLYDAVGMTPAYMDFGTGFNYGDWGDWVKEINRPVMLKYDGTVDYELDPDDQTYKIDGVTASDVDDTAYAGNAMSEFKLLYVYRYEDEDYEYVIFSDGPYDANYEALAHTDADDNIKDAFYFAMFEGTYVGTRLRSIGTGSVMVSQTATTEITRAEANGTGAGEGGGNVDGYWTITKSQWDFVNDLLVLISKSTDTQTAFGNGNSDSGSYLAAGTLKATGQFYGYSSTSAAVKVFYIENVLWGNYWMRMAGILMALDGEILAKMTPDYPTPSGDTVSTTGFTESGVTPTGGSGGYTKTVEITDIGYIPSDNTGGSASTYWCDGLWYTIGSTVKYALVSGFRTNAGLCGGRTVNLNNPASNTNTNIGSALSLTMVNIEILACPVPHLLVKIKSYLGGPGSNSLGERPARP